MVGQGGSSRLIVSYFQGSKESKPDRCPTSRPLGTWNMRGKCSFYLEGDSEKSHEGTVRATMWRTCTLWRAGTSAKDCEFWGYRGRDCQGGPGPGGRESW